MAKVKVLKEFRDKFNFSKIYKAGDEVDGFEKARIASLVERGLVETIGSKVVVGVGFGKIDISKPVKVVLEAIEMESDVKNLTIALEAENANEKPRKTVIAALNDRIAEITLNE